MDRHKYEGSFRRRKSTFEGDVLRLHQVPVLTESNEFLKLDLFTDPKNRIDHHGKLLEIRFEKPLYYEKDQFKE